MNAQVAELADAHDSKSCGKPCGFESHFGHQNKKVQTKSVLFCFQFQRVGLEKEWSSCGEVKAAPQRRQKMSSGHFLRRGLSSPTLGTIKQTL